MAEQTGAAADIRRVLLAATEPMSVSEIFAACDVVARTTEIASMMHVEYNAGRVARSGEKGSYRYVLTDRGRAIASDPKLLRTKSNRRVRGRPTPPIPAAALAAASTAPTPKAVHSVGVEESAAERGARLAASVLAQWPAPIHTIPVELLRDMQASLADALHAA